MCVRGEEVCRGGGGGEDVCRGEEVCREMQANTATDLLAGANTILQEAMRVRTVKGGRGVQGGGALETLEGGGRMCVGGKRCAGGGGGAWKLWREGGGCV